MSDEENNVPQVQTTTAQVSSVPPLPFLKTETPIAKTQPQFSDTKKPSTVIYCGPTIKGIVKQYAVYNGDLPTMLIEKINETPVIEKLIVPVTDLSKTKIAIETKGTLESIFYAQILEKTGGGN